MQTQQRLRNTRSNSSQVIRARTNQTKQKFEEVSHPIFYCVERFSKGDLKSKKGKQIIHFQVQSTTHTKTIIIRTILARNQYAFTPQCVFCLISTIETETTHRREGLELSTADLTNLTHRNGLTETDCDTAKRATPLLTCHRRQVFQQRLAKVITLSPDIRYRMKEDGQRYAMCALVLSWIQRQRNCQNYMLLKSRYLRNRISTTVLGYSSAEVYINTLLKYSTGSNSLPKKQSASSTVKKILKGRRTVREQRTNGLNSTL